MELFADLLARDPGAPRLTVYTEATGARVEFSAATLDNWAAKVANMLSEELDLDEDSRVLVDLPVGWQAAVIAFGALAARVGCTLTVTGVTPEDDAAAARAPRAPGATAFDAVFCAPEAAARYPEQVVVLVTEDPFGRGVEETGGKLPAGALDFGPTARSYADIYPSPTPSIADAAPDAPGLPGGVRAMSTGWQDDASFARRVVAPLAAGGSAVIVAGEATPERLDHIAAAERVTARL